LAATRRAGRAAVVCLALGAASALAQPITPDDPGPGDLRFNVNSTATAPKPISPYIYGVNFYGSSGFTNPVTLDRLGGNRWTGYNWETNDSNAGADYYHHNDRYLVGNALNTPPGEAVRPSLVAAAANNRALIVTVPIAGYVSADDDGTVDETQVAPSSRWHEIRAKKSSVYPGEALSLTPNEGDDYVFTDEFINWVEQTKQPGQPVFYSLDNEPGIWGAPIPPGWQSGNPNTGQQPTSRIATHPLIHPYKATFAEMRDKTVAHAGAIKDVNPEAMVFGAVSYGYAEFTNLQGAPDATSSPSHPGGNQGGELNYLEWLLREVKTAETAQGRKLMDVLDVHWYPEVYANNSSGSSVRVSDENSANPSQAIIDARVQMPRSLWDTTYTEPNSWITNCCSGGPIKLLKHLQRDVADFNPGTKISITEYNYGGGRHISGGVAQADVLGILGEEGVFAATLWPLDSGNNSRFTAGGFKMYLDYDGAAGDGQYGDLAIDAATDNISQSAVYASIDSDDPTRMVLVAINRTSAAKDVALQVTHDLRFDFAEAYQLTSASANPARVADVPIDLVNAFHYTMPALSVSTLVLRAFHDGDFDRDGVVDADDLAVWIAHAGMAEGAEFDDGDNDRDGDVDGEDFLAWQRNLGAGAPIAPSSSGVPEPSTAMLGVAAVAVVAYRRRSLSHGV
jgi:hypothetical protein